MRSSASTSTTCATRNGAGNASSFEPLLHKIHLFAKTGSGQTWTNAEKADKKALFFFRRAMQIVRETRSTEGAGMISSYCKKAGNIHAAIVFLIMAKQNADAFDHATTHE